MQRLTAEELEVFKDKVNRKVHWYGFDDLITKPESFEHLMAKLLYAIDYDFSYPLITYLLTNRMIDLEEIQHDPSSVDKLNQIGVTIYLNEPLSLRFDKGTLMADELDSILIYMKRNNLTNVTVYTCDYRCEELLPHYSNLKLITNDIFIKTITRTVSTLPTTQFTKKFINLNWRYDEHRHLVAAFMHQLDCYCSWRYVVDDSTIQIYNWVKLNELDAEFNGRIKIGIDSLKVNAPLIVDKFGPPVVVGEIPYIHSVKRPSSSGTEDIERFYADTFCDVVTETKYAQPTGNISEKTFRPIGYLKPFILVGPPRSLEYLKTMGYKTFSDYWDESYDSEENHQARLTKIFKLIDHINSKSIDELRQLYIDMQPILTHNANLLAETLPHRTLAAKLAAANNILRRRIWESKINA
jgi:hypothetical protein